MASMLLFYFSHQCRLHCFNDNRLLRPTYIREECGAVGIEEKKIHDTLSPMLCKRTAIANFFMHMELGKRLKLLHTFAPLELHQHPLLFSKYLHDRRIPFHLFWDNRRLRYTNHYVIP